MDQQDIKGKWNEIKDNVKDAWNKATDSKKTNTTGSNFSAAANNAKENLADLKPDVNEIKSTFTNGQKKAEYLKDKVGDTAKKGFDNVKGNIKKPA